MGVFRNDHILAFSMVFEPRSLPGTLSIYALPSFLHFVAHGRLSQKHLPRLLTVLHMVSPVSSKLIEMCKMHTLRINARLVYIQKQHFLAWAVWLGYRTGNPSSGYTSFSHFLWSTSSLSGRDFLIRQVPRCVEMERSASFQLPRDQLPRDQLSRDQLITRSTYHEINLSRDQLKLFLRLKDILYIGTHT